MGGGGFGGLEDPDLFGGLSDLILPALVVNRMGVVESNGRSWV